MQALKQTLLDLRNYILIKEKDKQIFWPWLNNDSDKVSANLFFAWAILDYQMPAIRVAENVEKLNSRLNYPKNLYETIINYSLEDWNSKWKEFNLHRFPKAHERLWKIGKRLCEVYGGDARNLWLNGTAATTYANLIAIGLGEQLSNMVLGALMDLEIIQGGGDVKADIHVSRVVGRLIEGKGFTNRDKQKVIDTTRKINPNNPWLIDRPLFLVGRYLCHSRNPECDRCPLQDHCTYFIIMGANKFD